MGTKKTYDIEFPMFYSEDDAFVHVVEVGTVVSLSVVMGPDVPWPLVVLLVVGVGGSVDVDGADVGESEIESVVGESVGSGAGMIISIHTEYLSL